ncbi:ThiF domain-containing protein [Mycena kentingensis (nom. inval.)]|nr:ThiF domain-containing protein [Mycena kentingensis (nom. inval.)]
MPLPDFSQLQHHLPQLTNTAPSSYSTFSAPPNSLRSSSPPLPTPTTNPTTDESSRATFCAAFKARRCPHHSSPRTVDADYEQDKELIEERLARNYAFFGDAGMEKIHAGGVSHIRLIDFDYVTLSSLNRHATALLSDVGDLRGANIARLWGGGKLLGGADWVIDVIDNIRVFSSIGAGAKTDPTRIQIADTSNTVCDPLARAVRRCLRLAGIASGIPSSTPPKTPVEELGVMDDERVRVLPVLSPLPAIFGLHAVMDIFSELAGKPVREDRRAGLEPTGVQERMPMDEDKASFLLDDPAAEIGDQETRWDYSPSSNVFQNGARRKKQRKKAEQKSATPPPAAPVTAAPPGGATPT